MSIIKSIKKSKIGEGYYRGCDICFAILCKCSLKRAVSRRFQQNLGYKPNFENPKSINEKLQLLKLNGYYNNELITRCVDKYLVKQYIDEIFPDGELKNAKLYGVYDSVAEFKKNGLENFPDKFVIKCNHGCGYNIICNDKSKLDLLDTEQKLTKWINEEFWTRSAEPQYRFVKHKIIVEENLGSNIEAYKIYCFNGIPRIAYVSSADEAGNKDVYLDYFDMNWNHLDVSLGLHRHYPGNIPCPRQWIKMLDIAKKLSSPFPFVRVDLYEVNDDIYLSELTFLPTGGYMKLNPRECEQEWGSWLTL